MKLILLKLVIPLVQMSLLTMSAHLSHFMGFISKKIDIIVPKKGNKMYIKKIMLDTTGTSFTNLIGLWLQTRRTHRFNLVCPFVTDYLRNLFSEIWYVDTSQQIKINFKARFWFWPFLTFFSIFGLFFMPKMKKIVKI